MRTRARTFKVKSPRMRGQDIRLWQQEISDKFRSMNIGIPIVVDGVYGSSTRQFSRMLAEAMGLEGSSISKSGVTPRLRIEIREIAGKGRAAHKPGVDGLRDGLRRRYGKPKLRLKVSKPVVRILEDSWGYHPGVHDGLDVICDPAASVFAMCKAKVVDVRSSGWWGLGAQPSGGHSIGDGDGIITIEVLENVGPFKKGQHICYGHAEGAIVREGQVVKAGQKLGRAGFANAWHIHLMVNDGTHGDRGVGNLDPRPFLEFTKNHG